MKRQRVFYGWWIVASGVGIGTLTSSLFVYGFSAFFVPWREAFGWPRAVLGSLVGLARLEGGAFGPLAGWLIDKYGPRRILLMGLAMFGLGFLALSRVNSLATLYLVYLGLLATGSSLGTNRPIQVALANWFVRRRGRAMGILSAGTGIGGIFVFLLGMLIAALGWRTAAILAGLTMWGIGLPLAIIVRHRPEQMGLLPDGDRAPAATLVAAAAARGDAPLESGSGNPTGASSGDPVAASPLIQKPRRFWMSDPKPEIDMTVWQALRTPAFWLLATTYAIWSATPTINTVYLAPFLVEELKMDYVVALSAVSLFALISTFGRLIFGFIADYVNLRLVTAILMVTQGVGILLFSQVQTTSQVPFYIIIFAVAHGGVLPLRAVLQGYFFGRKQFGTIGGVLTLVDLPATVAAPIWVAWLADAVPGGYRLAFKIIGGTLAIAAVSILLARRPSHPMP